MPLNFNHLALFHAVAEAGSVSGAARKLRLTQPSITKQIRELEAALEAELFERRPRGMRLTPAGELLAGYARKLFALAGEAERALGDLRGLRRGRLAVGASMTIGVYLLPKLLAECRRRWPGLELEIHVENTDTIQKALVDHQWDLGLTEGPGQWDRELDERVFRWDELIAVGRADGGPAPKTTLTLPQLLAMPWVMREPGSGTRAVVDEALARRGRAVTPAWTFNSPEAIKQAVLAGCGIAWMPRISVEAELAAGQLRHLQVRGWTLRRPFRLQWLRGRPQTAAMQAFAALTEQAGR